MQASPLMTSLSAERKVHSDVVKSLLSNRD